MSGNEGADARGSARWILSTQHHVNIEMKEEVLTSEGEAEDGEGEKSSKIVMSIRKKVREELEGHLTQEQQSWLETALDDLDRSIVVSQQNEENAQTLLRELANLVRNQKVRIEGLKANAKAAEEELKELKFSERSSQVVVEATSTLPPEHVLRPNDMQQGPHLQSKISSLPRDRQGVQMQKELLGAKDQETPVPEMIDSVTNSYTKEATAKSFQWRLKAEQDSVRFWKRRCQTKDTLVKRLQAIVKEQKSIIAYSCGHRSEGNRSHRSYEVHEKTIGNAYREREGRTSMRDGGSHHRVTKEIPSDEENDSDDVEAHNDQYDYGRLRSEDRRSRRRSQAHRYSQPLGKSRPRLQSGNSTDKVSSSRAKSSRDRETSHVLLDIPHGVHGNVELNLSWPPSTSSIEDEDEDDDEEEDIRGSSAPTALSTIDEEDESREEESLEETCANNGAEKHTEEAKKEVDELNNLGSDSSITSSSIELSRSLQSDDSGLLFERYL